MTADSDLPGDGIPAEAPLLVPPFLPPHECVVAADGTRRYEQLTYARNPGYRPRLLDAYVPAASGRVPAVVWVHGGGWLDGDRRFPPPTLPAEQLFGSLTRAGLAAVTVDYRHGLEAPFPAQLHDVRAAIRYVRRFADELGIDPDRIGLWGESAGGHLVALAALAPGTAPDGTDLDGHQGVGEGDLAVQAVVDWYGVSEVASASRAFPAALAAPPNIDPTVALLGGVLADRLDLARTASPVSYADHPAPPFLLLHGTQDSVVPHSQSELLAERLKAHTHVELELVPGADHIFAGADVIEPIVARSVDFLAHHLA